MTVLDATHRYYVVDLETNPVTLSGDGENRTWLQALPLGEYKHPLWGQIKLTAQRVANFAKNFNDNVRGTELDIDYDHKAKTDKAAGWVKQVEDRGLEGLWYLVEWTPEALKALQDKEYKYFSPEFADEWTNPISGQTYQDVLFGGALTNRPFLKDILPINLSDFGHINIQEEESKMDELIQQLAELLGIELSEKDSEEVTTKKFTDAVTQLQESASQEPPGEEDDELKKLAEDNPVIAKLLADRQQDRADIIELQARNRLSEVNTMLSEAKSDSWALPPVFVDAVRPVLTKLSEAHTTKLMDAITKLTETGLVQLGEIGSRGTGGQGTDLVKQFHDEIATLQKDNDKLSYADAVQRVASEKPELFDAYNDAQIGVH